MGLLSLIGIVGAIGWLLTARRPVVNLRVLKDRTFAVCTLLIGVVGVVLYASAVLIPQFSQQVIGYTATLAGLVLTPGGVAIIVLIPVMNQVLKRVQTRYVIAFGFGVMGVALIYSAHLILQVDYRTLVYYRVAQSCALGFLFVPISTIAFQTVPRELNGDASALFSMSRNVLGAIGISASTSLVTERTQVQEAHMVHWMTPFHQPYDEYLNQARLAARGVGQSPAAASGIAQHQLFQQFTEQATVLAYNDCFLIFSLVAFAVIPFCFLLKPGISGGGGGAGH